MKLKTEPETTIKKLSLNDNDKSNLLSDSISSQCSQCHTSITQNCKSKISLILQFIILSVLIHVILTTFGFYMQFNYFQARNNELDERVDAILKQRFVTYSDLIEFSETFVNQANRQRSKRNSLNNKTDTFDELYQGSEENGTNLDFLSDEFQSEMKIFSKY